MRKPKDNPLPKTVYIIREDGMLYADEDFKQAAHGALVGIYKLEEIRVKRIKEDLI